MAIKMSLIKPQIWSMSSPAIKKNAATALYSVSATLPTVSTRRNIVHYNIISTYQIITVVQIPKQSCCVYLGVGHYRTQLWLDETRLPPSTRRRRSKESSIRRPVDPSICDSQHDSTSHSKRRRDNGEWWWKVLLDTTWDATVAYMFSV
jgi:hypothetical protein